MIPLVGKVQELAIMKQMCVAVADMVLQRRQRPGMPYKVGTMIEVPRAALTADEIAKEAEFFSFGTNDLTQMACGFSRDDSGVFLKEYVRLGIYDEDPFQVLDQEGVGQLVAMAVEKGRRSRANLKCGICGEHGGEPSSVKFCHRVGLDYVSCSPFRVPVAIIAAAQVAIEEERQKPKKTFKPEERVAAGAETASTKNALALEPVKNAKGNKKVEASAFMTNVPDALLGA